MTNVSPPRSRFEKALDNDADLLAESLRNQWRAEEEQRKIRDPIPLLVRWRSAPDELMDHWSNIHRSPDGSVCQPLSLAGRLDEILEVHRRIPSRRLVVLGRAGSGKTILTIRFVLDRLAARGNPADPVPVLFSLTSWNPSTTTLRRWMTGQLERDYPRLAERRDQPGLARAGPGGSTRAAALVGNDRILPVLDGFDEIADGLHRPALEALNDTDMPLLLTSRRTEYAAAVAGTRVLASAAVVELTALSLADLDNYLPRTTRKATPTSTVWDPVLKHLRDHPRHPAGVRLATVLATPLMVALARTIYSDTPDRDPSVLLDTDRFRTPEALEDHLLDNFIPTVYRDQTPAHRARIPHRLGYLAQHLDRLGTRDLAWWQLGSTLPRSSRMCVIGLVTALAFGLVDALLMWPVIWHLGFGLVPGLRTALLNGASFGSTCGLGFGLVYGLRYGMAAPEPSRVRVRLLGGTKEMRKEIVPRLVIGLIGGYGFGFLAWTVSTLVIGLAEPSGYGLLTLLAVGAQTGLIDGLLYGPAAGLTFALMALFEAPIDIETAVSPPALLRANRATVLFHLLLFVLFIVLASGILCWAQLIRFADWIAIGGVGGLGGGLAYALSLTAWGQWVSLSRIWLPLTGRLPWTVHAFLKDAHRRGVLRQSGAVYQFRHARLQDHLAHVSRMPR
ncbi:NACHT domain-containing protein [Streptomyces celluloflavus]|uniref:NACHT domain-containing protein n=1 Tax=Streptomyces celluloflavus TaxID=58344 RepID=UPI0036941355